MEEDIKILEGWIEDINKAWEKNDWFEEMPAPKEKVALENLIKGYKELEEELERQKEINTIINKENLDDKYEKALEKVMTKFLNDNVNNDFIPKSKIKEKIEELETKLKVFEKDTRYCKERVQARLMNDEIYVLRRCRNLLQELMEDK